MKNLSALMAVLVGISASIAQTRVDLRTQSKQVDLANANWTRPVKTGTDLPSVCGPGELYFLTTAPVGRNLYGCVGTNQWAAQNSSPSGTSSGSAFPESIPGVQRTSDTMLTVGAECSTLTPCRVRFGQAVLQLTTSSRINLLSGTGTVWIAVSPWGEYQVGYSGSLSLTCINCRLLAGASAFQPQSLAIWRWLAPMERRWDSGTGTDMRALLGRDAPVLAGTGLVSVEDPATGSKTLHLDTAGASTGLHCNASAPVTNAYSCALSPALQTYAAGMVLTFHPAAWNTGAATLNAGAGALPLLRNNGSELQPLELNADEYYHVVCTGTQFRLMGTYRPPADDSVIELADEFVIRSGTSLGSLGWNAENLTGNAFGAAIYTDSTEPGYLRLETPASGTAASVSEAAAYLRSNPGAVDGSTAIYLSQPGWTCRIRVRIPDTTVPGATLRAGFSENQTTLGSNALYVQYQHGANGGAWALYNGASKILQSTVAATSNTWHWITVSSFSAGQVSLKVDGEAAQTAAVTIPAVAMAPGISYLIPAGSWTTRRAADIGRWSYKRIGVVR